MTALERLMSVSDSMLEVIERTKAGSLPTDQGDVIARAGYVVVRSEEIALQTRLAVTAGAVKHIGA